MKPVTVVVVGAGQRGKAYCEYAQVCPDKLKVVSVVEPRQFHREKLCKTHNVSSDLTFKNVLISPPLTIMAIMYPNSFSWEEVAGLDKLADCAIIATPDRDHRAPAVALAKKGYHILLEKPMAATYADCVEIVEVCRENKVMLAVGHVLRYSREATRINELIKSGVIGDVVNIQHLEPVGFYHFAHSFVRGNWRNEELSSFMLLAKSCHDLDLVQMWMGNKNCSQISSFGSLYHFNKKNQPAGASSRCMDCSVESTCPYSAKKIYLGMLRQGVRGWPLSVITEVPDIESVTEALQSGPYGRCVYECDNDVVDNQVVNLKYEDGSTVNLSVVAFSEKVCQRQTKVFGTKGQITSDFNNKVAHFDFLTSKETVHDLLKDTSRMYAGGHSGCDMASVEAFIKAVATGDSSHILTDAHASLYSHMLCFAAEKSRIENRIVNPTEEFKLNIQSHH